MNKEKSVSYIIHVPLTNLVSSSCSQRNWCLLFCKSIGLRNEYLQQEVRVRPEIMSSVRYLE